MSLNCWKIYFRNIPYHYWNLKIKAPLPLNTYICILIESNIVWAGSFSVELPKNTTISFQCTKITQKKSSTFVLYSFTMVLKLRNYKEKQKKSFWTTYEPQYCTRVFSHFKRKEVQISQETESQLKPQKTSPR